MIAYVIILMAFQNPDSVVVVLGSMIPFTSPIVMLARIPYGVPAHRVDRPPASDILRLRLAFRQDLQGWNPDVRQEEHVQGSVEVD